MLIPTNLDTNLLELKEDGWTMFNYREKFDLDYRPDNCERINVNKISKEEFIERFEMKYRPVVITGICDSWKCIEKWNLEVNYIIHSKNFFDIFVFSLNFLLMKIKRNWQKNIVIRDSNVAKIMMGIV